MTFWLKQGCVCWQTTSGCHRTPAGQGEEQLRFAAGHQRRIFVTQKGESLWQCAYYEAFDLVSLENERRCDQVEMTIANQRENIFNFAKGTLVTEAELTYLQLPGVMDRASLHLQLRMLRGLTKQETLAQFSHFEFSCPTFIHKQEVSLRRWKSFSICVSVYPCLLLPLSISVHTLLSENLTPKHSHLEETQSYGNTTRPQRHFGLY